MSVGAWINGRMGGASISYAARRNDCTAFGLATVRWALENHRMNRSSRARLGTLISAKAWVPHSWSTWARIASATSTGSPIG
jgi:hypothetical protein